MKIPKIPDDYVFKDICRTSDHAYYSEILACDKIHDRLDKKDTLKSFDIPDSADNTDKEETEHH